MCNNYSEWFPVAWVLSLIVMTYLGYDYGKQKNEPPF